MTPLLMMRIHSFKICLLSASFQPGPALGTGTRMSRSVPLPHGPFGVGGRPTRNVWSQRPWEYGSHGRCPQRRPKHRENVEFRVCSHHGGFAEVMIQWSLKPESKFHGQREDEFCARFVFQILCFPPPEVPFGFLKIPSISLIIEFMFSLNIREGVVKIYNSYFNIFACSFHHRCHFWAYYYFFLLVTSHVPLLVCKPGNFAVVGTGFRFIPWKNIGLCFGSYLKTVWSFQGLLFNFVMLSPGQPVV